MDEQSDEAKRADRPEAETRSAETRSAEPLAANAATSASGLNDPAARGGADQIERGVDPTAPIEPGAVREVAEGVFLFANPVAFPPGFQNAYLLADEDENGAPSWTLVDPGLSLTENAWRERLAGPFAERRLTRIIATHHHPDHIGAAGALQRDGATLATTRTAWLFARMMQLDDYDAPAPEAERFYAAAGFDEPMLERWRQRSRLNFAAMVHPLPLGYERLREDDAVTIGGRRWRVLMGHGHAPEHLMLCCEADDLLLAGDQILPRISPNIGVYPTEPNGDPLGEWLDSCHALVTLLAGRRDMLVLPGHGDPFRGPAKRLRRILEKHETALERLAAFLDKPRTAVECFEPMFRRALDPSHEGLAVAETLAHLHRLTRLGKARRVIGADGVHRFERA
ncbi:MAG: MBL fold metallo-hydrolase [Pseudomonadota bacterium]